MQTAFFSANGQKFWLTLENYTNRVPNVKILDVKNV